MAKFLFEKFFTSKSDKRSFDRRNSERNLPLDEDSRDEDNLLIWEVVYTKL